VDRGPPDRGGRERDDVRAAVDGGAAGPPLPAGADDDPGFYPSLVSLYTKQSNETLEEIYDLFVAGNLDLLGKAAHKLKGSSLNLGARQVAELCRIIEESCLKGDQKSIENALQELRKVYNATTSALKISQG